MSGVEAVVHLPQHLVRTESLQVAVLSQHSAHLAAVVDQDRRRRRRVAAGRRMLGRQHRGGLDKVFLLIGDDDEVRELLLRLGAVVEAVEGDGDDADVRTVREASKGL